MQMITCPRCLRTSHNPNDIAQGYCGACHDWTQLPMSDPFNQLPADPEWIKRADALTVDAAQDLKCTVLLIAIQEVGKIGISVAGVPKTGPLADVMQDVPTVLASLALMCRAQEVRSSREGKSH